MRFAHVGTFDESGDRPSTGRRASTAMSTPSRGVLRPIEYLPMLPFLTVPFVAAAALAQPIEEISVVASRVPTPLADATAPVEVIDRAAIEARQSSQAADLLRGMTGFAVSQSGGPGSVTEVRLRGAEANHLLVAIDGISINDPALGSSVDFANLDLIGTHRIEILPGAQTALWGSDALAGIINIETTPGPGAVTRRVAIDGGSDDTISEAIELAYARAPWYYALAARHTRTDGTNIALAGGENDGYRNTTTHLNTGYRSERGSLRVVARSVDATSQYDPTPYPDYVPRDGDLELDVRQRIGGIAGSYQLLRNWDQRIALTHYDAHNDNYENGLRTASSDGAKTRVGYQTDIHLHGARITLAYDHQREDYSQAAPATEFGDPNQHQHYSSNGVVAEVAGSLSRVTGTLSARYDDNSDFANASSYRAALRFAVSRHTALYLSAGTGRKNPTFTERYGYTPDTFIGNSSLRPEQSKSASLTVAQTFGNVDLRVAVYRDELTDEIDGFVFDPDVGGFTARNIDGTSHRHGVEVALDYGLTEATDLHLDVSYVDATEPDGARELRRPRYSGRLLVDQRWLGERMSLQLGVAYSGNRDDADFATFPATRVDLGAYTLIHCAARLKLSERFDVTGRIENLSDAHYEDVFGYATPGRRGFIGLRMTL